MLGNSLFLVRFSGQFFFTRRREDDGRPKGVIFPSQARAMGYLTAFQIVQTLRSKGYNDAVVCLPDGFPALPADIADAKDSRGSTNEFISVWGLDPVVSVLEAQ
jgi:hypothetical protein